MFKNPLKYQQGGTAPSQEEQQILAAFIQWLPKRVKEFQGMQPEQVAQALDGMTKTEEGKKQLQQLMAQFQQEMQGGSQAFRQGGKIHDFICKHRKGGKAGCGCKEDGGKVAKAQGGGNESIWGPAYTDDLDRWRNFYDEYNGFAGTVNMNSGKAYKAETNEEMLQPGRYNRKGYPIQDGYSTNGTWYEVNPRGSILVNIPEGGQQVLHGNDSTAVANLINQWDQKKAGHAVTAKEDGGKVKKADKGKKLVNATINAAMAENPAVMTASGWRRDSSGNMVQDAVSEPGVDKLRDNLAAISTLSFTHPGNLLLNSTVSKIMPMMGGLRYFPTYGIKVALEGADVSTPKKETTSPTAGDRFKAPTNYYNENGVQISEEDALRRNNRTFYTEEPTAAGNLSWSNNEMAKQLMWPGVIQDVQYNQPVGHYIDEYGNMHNFSVEGNDLTRYNNRKAQWKKCGGKVEKAQGGKKVNNNRRTITEVGRGLDEYDAKEMGIDPNTLAGTSSIITAYPNKKPYVVDGQVPFWTRNGLVFDLGAVESGYIEDGTRMSKGVPGRKYKVSSVLDQDGLLNFSYNENAKEFPMISRFASPKDTIYYLNFNDFDKNTLGYEEVRSMYNKAIDQPDTFALNKEAYLELQRQKQERASKKENSGKVEK